jgi:hypothetical protein
VSEVLGTTFVIAITLVSAMLTVALAGAALQAMNDETQDSLTRDSFHEMNNRLQGLADNRVDETTRFRFPSGAGSSVEAMPSEGNVTITASVSNEEYESLVEADTDVNTTNFTVGTVRYEDRRGNTIVYQSGGVWEYRSSEYAVRQSPPPFDYDGQRINFQFVNISELLYVNEGDTVVARRDVAASRERSAAIRDELAPQWTIPSSAGYTVQADINVTIESEYAIGWKQYAEEGMREPPDDIIYRDNAGLPGHKPNVTLIFSGVGSTDLPNYPPPVVYAGEASKAAHLYDPHSNSTIESTGENKFEINHNNPPAQQKQQLAFYDKHRDEWVIHWHQSGSGPPKDSNNDWYNVSETIDGFGVPAYDDDTEPPQIDFYDFDPNTKHEYGFTDGSTQTCIVSYDETSDFPGAGAVDSLETCAANLDVEDKSKYMPTNLTVNITTDVSEAVVGESEEIDVEIENVGGLDSEDQHDLGLYRELDGELDLVAYNTSDDIGTIDANTKETVTMRWTPAEPGNVELHAVLGVHDTNSTDVSVEPRNVDLQVNITDDTADTVPLGQELEVNATIKNTGNAPVTDANVMLRNETGIPVDVTKVDLDPDEETNVSLYWTAPTAEDGFSEELEVDTLWGNDTHVVEDAGNPNFEVTIEDVTEPAENGVPMNVTATITNTGGAAGTQDVLLIADTEQVDELVADSIEVGDLGVDNSTTVTFTWDSPVRPQKGDNVVTVRSQDANATHEFDVAPFFDVEIDDVTPDSVEVASGQPQPIDVDVTVANVGDLEGTQAIELGVPDGSDLQLTDPDTEVLTVDGDDSKSLTLDARVQSDSLTGNLSVASEDDRERSRVIIERDGPDCESVDWNGDGSVSSPYEISNIDQLQCLTYHVEQSWDHGSKYVITEDIDAYGTKYWNDGAGFEPIAEQDRSGDHFRGDIDGQGHTIEGLTIDRPDEAFVGIFAVTHSFENDGVGTGVTIENIRLRDVDVHGKTVVGGLVGGAGGSIERIYVSGRVESEYQQVGGIVGHGHDADLNNELVSTATVTGTYPAALDGEHPWHNGDQANLGIGGIVGGTGYNTDIATAYSRATVTGNSGVGGITGWTSDYDSTNEQMYWVGGNVERTGPWRLDEMDRENLSAPDSPTAGAIAGRMELDSDNFEDSVYADENYSAIGEQKADADAVSLPASEMVGAQVLPDSEASNYPGVTEADTEGTMENLDWDIWEPVYDINETGAIVNKGSPIFEWQARGAFVVEEIDAPDAVTEGESVAVTATVRNTKHEADTQGVRLYTPDGSPVGVTELSLGPDEAANVSLEWDTRIGDNTTGLDDPALTVQTDDGANAKAFEVLPQEPPEFLITDIEGEDGTEGEKVNVTVTLENVGGPGSQNVFLKNDDDDELVASESVDLDSGAEKEVNLTWYTQHGDGDTDPQSVTARTPYDDSSTTVDITEADTASFEFEAVRFPGFDGETPSVNAGSSLTLNVTVKNTGPVEGTELIWLTPETSIDILDHNETELAAGEQTSFNMTWKPTRPEVDTLEVNIGADGPTERRDVIVQDPLGRVTADPIDVDISQIKIDS